MDQFESFFEELSSSAPVPGGGSVAALNAAMGAALLVMVCNLTLGKKRYADVQDRIGEIKGRAQSLLERARSLAAEDASAFQQVSDAMTLPRETNEERARRQERLQEALKGAAEPPLATMEAAWQVARLASELVAIGNRSAVTDVGTAALEARASFEAALLNVLVNLGAVKDETWVSDFRRRLSDIGDPRALSEEVRLEVQRTLQVP